MCADTEGNIPAHLAAKWCSREENYGDYKLVMTPLVRAAPESLTVANTSGETAQGYLDKGAKRIAEAKSARFRQSEPESPRTPTPEYLSGQQWRATGPRIATAPAARFL